MSRHRLHLSYRWKLFLPITAAIWAVIICMIVWQRYYVRKSCLEMISSQISLINGHIVRAYEEDFDPDNFLRSIRQYYIDHPLYDHVRVSVYLHGSLVYNVGKVIRLNDNERRIKAGLTGLDNTEREEALRHKQNYYYSVAESSDKALLVYTMLPMTDHLEDAVAPSGDVYIYAMLIAAIATIFAYIYSRNVGRNISNLRDFARRAALGSGPVQAPDFPHDELGDISRQITKLFTDLQSTLDRLEHEHEVAIHTIEEKARLKRELTNNINHEIKTPLSIIKGYLDTIYEHPDIDDATLRHFIEKARENIERLTSLLASVSLMTRLNDGAAMISTQEVDYHDIVYNAAADYAASGVMHGMTFTYDIPLGCKVQANGSLLSAMIDNIVKNAVSYSKGTNIHLSLIGQTDTHYIFRIADNGVGVKPEALPRLFERFYRGDSGRSRKTGGTGLGLSIVYSTVTALGGEIKAENATGGGLAFTYTLLKSR